VFGYQTTGSQTSSDPGWRATVARAPSGENAMVHTTGATFPGVRDLWCVFQRQYIWHERLMNGPLERVGSG
jgi:hypothetical protein